MVVRTNSRSSRGRAALAALVWALGASGLAGQDPVFPVLAADAPAGTGDTAACRVGPIAEGVRCGVFRVHENRAAAEGRTLDLHFVILDALEPERRTDDPVLFFFGGPGGTTTDAAPGLAFGLGEVRRARDLVLVDLRGIGRSGGLSCTVPYPRGIESRFGALFALDQLTACRDSLATVADLRQYTTPITVDDLEELRRWLGYRAVNLFGGSYGTRVNQVYMRRHPEAVRTVFMSGVTPVFDHGYARTSPYLQQALERVIDECGRQPACAEAYPDLPGMVEQAFGRFADGPVPVALGDRVVPFHAADLGYALRGLLYDRASEVPYRIRQAARGELRELAEYYLERTDWVAGEELAAGNHLSVICAEDIRPVTDEEVERAAEGTFLRGHVINSYRAACSVWPEAELPGDFFELVRSDIPTLLVSGGHDPVTPPSGGEEVAAGLSRHLHVVVPNGGHGSMSPCVLSMVVRLIDDGNLDNVDPSCVTEVPPTRFRLP